MKDYYNNINEQFLKKIELKDDESFVNISSLRYNQDKLLIDDIINKPILNYKYLNEKEIGIIKKFNISIREFNDDINIKYIQEEIKKILNLPNEELIVYCMQNNIDGLIDIDVMTHNGTKYLYFTQGNNNIPNSKLYEDDNFLNTYKEIIKEILEKKLNLKIDEEIYSKIINYEIKLDDKKISYPDKRNIKQVFNEYSISNVKFKNINFSKLINLLLEKNVDINTHVFIDSVLPNIYYNLIDNFLSEIEFRYYILWSIILKLSSVSLGSLYDSIFKLVKIVKGIKKKMDFDKKVYILNNQLIGHIISKEYFINIDPTIEKQITNYITYIKKCFRERLKNNKWMGNKTKEIAIKKLDKIKADIYRSKLVDYNDIKELTNIYFKNIHIINEYSFKKKINELYSNDKYFIGNVYNINAYYETTTNQITFPHGILKPPYYYNTDINNLDANNLKNIAYNFGAIGSVIGHEIIHGFDDQGRLFDENGNLKNWWDKQSEENYLKLTEQIGNIYKGYGINPSLTMGENIADIGGVRISLSAFRLFLEENKLKLDDILLSNFINGWAMVWRGKYRKEEKEIRLLTDPHSPIMQRVNIPINNLIETRNINIKNNEEHDLLEIW